MLTNDTGPVSIEGHAVEPEIQAERPKITPDYFRAMGIPLLRGRGLSDRDTRDAPKVLLINEAFARQYFPNEDPIGRVLTGRGTIVGVVGDVRQARLDRPAAAEIYYPVAQNFAQIRSLGSTMLVSGHLPPQSLVSAVRKAVREVNPRQAAFGVETMERVIADSIANQRLYLWLLGLFAAAGIYGVIAYLVTLRTQEFGIRMALGADAGRVLRLVMGRGAVLVALGLAIGFGGAAALTRFLKTVLYGVSATDPVTFGAMALLLAAVALTACVIPARRAARVDPAVALRSE